MKIAAVLFDLDGTLVETLPGLRRAYHRFLAAYGHTSTDAEFEEWNGPPLSEIVRGLLDRHAIDAPFEHALGRYLGFVDEDYVESAVLVEGAPSLLAELRNEGRRLALVTSAPDHLARGALARHGLLSLFDEIVGAGSAPAGKMTPDGYRLALARLAIPAACAVAVEDSPNGVRAATNAGLRCVALGSDRHMELSMAGAAVVVDTMADVRAVIDGLEEGCGRVIAAEKVSIVLAPSSDYDTATEARVASIWDVAKTENPRLVDGTVVSVSRWRVAEGALALAAQPVRYRHFIAQRRGLHLGVTTVGVQGVTWLDEGDASPRRLVLGKRSLSVTQYPGAWELAPAGGLSAEHAVDPAAALLDELAEELGIERSEVRAIRALGLVEDIGDRVLDLCFRIDVAVAESRVRAAFRATGEYDDVRFVPASDIAELVGSPDVVPTMRAILALDTRP